jgi:hypothetical protein
MLYTAQLSMISNLIMFIVGNYFIFDSSTTKACDGPCSGKTCCTSKCSGGSPVCGANGKDYDSECLAVCE